METTRRDVISTMGATAAAAMMASDVTEAQKVALNKALVEIKALG